MNIIDIIKLKEDFKYVIALRNKPMESSMIDGNKKKEAGFIQTLMIKKEGNRFRIAI